MFTTITITLIILVAINFLLLIFSCNKTVTKKKTENNPGILRQTKPSNEQAVNQLAPTGS